MQHLYKRGKTNLGGEGETKIKQGAEAVLVDLIIPYLAIAYCLKWARATAKQGAKTIRERQVQSMLLGRPLLGRLSPA